MSSAVNDAKKIYIIGIGDDGPAGFTEEARLRVAAADLLIGAATLTASLQDCDADRWDPEGDFQAVLDKIAKHAADDVVVLASGDGDFAILADHIRARHGCQVEVYGVAPLTAAALMRAADDFIPIEGDLLLG